MLFRLVNAPATFQIKMNKIFFDYLDQFCIVFYDILIYSENLEQHVQRVFMVFERLAKNSLYAKLKQCNFSVVKVDFHGYIFSNLGNFGDPKRVKSI